MFDRFLCLPSLRFLSAILQQIYRPETVFTFSLGTVAIRWFRSYQKSQLSCIRYNELLFLVISSLYTVNFLIDYPTSIPPVTDIYFCSLHPCHRHFHKKSLHRCGDGALL